VQASGHCGERLEPARQWDRQLLGVNVCACVRFLKRGGVCWRQRHRQRQRQRVIAVPSCRCERTAPAAAGSVCTPHHATPRHAAQTVGTHTPMTARVSPQLPLWCHARTHTPPPAHTHTHLHVCVQLLCCPAALLLRLVADSGARRHTHRALER
jgi:hypothetical protein